MQNTSNVKHQQRKHKTHNISTNISQVHSNDMVPLYLDGTYGRVSHDILFDNIINYYKETAMLELILASLLPIPLKYTTTIFSSHRSHSNTKVLIFNSSSLQQWFETVIHPSQTLQAIQGKDLNENFNHHLYVLRR